MLGWLGGDCRKSGCHGPSLAQQLEVFDCQGSNKVIKELIGAKLVFEPFLSRSP
jgi:hypothetical protein